MEGLYYTRKLVGIKSEDFSIVTLPGEPEFRRYDGRLLSYLYNPLEVKKVMEEIYNVKPLNPRGFILIILSIKTCLYGFLFIGFQHGFSYGIYISAPMVTTISPFLACLIM